MLFVFSDVSTNLLLNNYMYMTFLVVIIISRHMVIW